MLIPVAKTGNKKGNDRQTEIFNQDKPKTLNLSIKSMKSASMLVCF